jgi:protein O-GlcNAc transferase
MSSPEKVFRDALGAFNILKYDDAERLFKKFLKSQPKHVGALNLLTIVLMRMQRFAEAEEFIAKAVTLNQGSDVSFYNYGIILKALNKPERALEQFTNALRLNSKEAETWNNRGTIYNDLKQYEKAISDFDQAISLSPGYAGAVANKGKSLSEIKLYAEALTAYDKALSLKPDLAEAWLGRGKVFVELERCDEAVAAYDKAISFKPDLAEAWLGRGSALFELKRHGEALAAFDKALLLKPDLTEAWFGRGSAVVSFERYDEAVAAYDKALSLKPDLAEAWLGRGNAAANLKRYDEAVAAYDMALSFKPDLAEVWLGRGNVFVDLKRHDEAFAAYDKALSLKPDLEGAWLGRGNAFAGIEHYDDAFIAYDKALSLNPDLAETWLGRGNAMVDLKRYDEALADYDKAFSLKPDLAETWLGRGNAMVDLKRYDEAFAAYDKALLLKPDLAKVWLGRGNVFFNLKRYGEALAAYDKALSLKSDLAEVWLGRGNVFLDLKRHEEAFAAYDKALSLEPDLAAAWLGRGNVFSDLKRHEEAFLAYDKALSLKPDLAALEGMRIFSKMQLCDWSNFETERDHLVQSVRNGKENTAPFAFLGIGPSIEDQFSCAKLWVRKLCPPADKPFWRGESYKNNKIRICYVSADFHQHPVANLVAGVFECHDRSQFEVIGISIGPNDNSEIRRRLECAFDEFIDAEALGFDEIAKQAREEEIDILIDLTGFTDDARTEIFACRPAPIQVNYLGYPGTMGASYIDYIIADPALIPASHQSSYLEKIVYLPHSYLPHDDTSRRISDRSFERGEFGLPENGFVFCCFNNAYKLNPYLFRSRMKLLQAVEGSVLWLSENNATATNNLRREAAAAGVNPDRLVFAGRVPSSADHLARHRLADLFLDTLPYNAHTTASDALLAGLPVLTQIGETFAGRVAASLLTAIGLPELIVQTQEQFESMAIELATRPELMAAIKDKLVENRLTKPLFNTKLYTRHIESAYASMHQRHQSGLLPDHIYVAE